MKGRMEDEHAQDEYRVLFSRSLVLLENCRLVVLLNQYFFVAKEDSLAERLMIVEREEIIKGITSWKTQPGVDEELS